ncbi:MAG: potassium-transporting ATPase subunit KdpC [Gemmatimonadetes bacterium]|nr:potassium-transporting ATPase subunit KdpC [Gemmatimonadota bacterium]
MLKNQLRPAILITLVLTVITGVLYPAAVTGIAQVLFPRQANGSLVAVNGTVVGSELIAQQFAAPQYFHSRPSFGAGYSGAASGGTNKGPTDLKLADTLIEQAVDSAIKLDGAVKGKVPSDLVTSSGSGLDPHISPASAELQVARIARVRGATPEAVRDLVAAATQCRMFGFLGDPRVNVLKLNLALDSALPLGRRAENR